MRARRRLSVSLLLVFYLATVALARGTESLRARLTHDDASVRLRAVDEIGRMRPEAAVKFLPELVEAFGDGSVDLRNLSPGVVGRLGAAAVPALRVALGEIGKPAAPALPELVALLDDGYDLARFFACGAIGAIGPAAHPAAEALRGNLHDSSTLVRDAAATALRLLGEEVDDRAPRKPPLRFVDEFSVVE